MNTRLPVRPPRNVKVALLAGALLCGAVPVSAFAAGQGPGLPLTVVADVPLPGDTSRFDYESYDPARHLLFIAHLGQSEILVFDTRAQRVVKTIGGARHVHGVLAIPQLGRVYASATGTDEVVAIDAERLTEVARVPGGAYPDGMAYAPQAGKLYVSDETGATETVIDVSSNRRIATIPLGGEVGNTQYDPVSRHIFVNVQSRRQLVQIDPAADQVVARMDLPGAKGNHGLLIEPDLRLAFIANPTCAWPSSPARITTDCWCSIWQRDRSGARSRSARGPTFWPTTPGWA